MNASPQSAEFWRARLVLPNYEIREAARFAHVHSTTVSRWHKNTTLGAKEPGTKLSYMQLIELAVAASCKEAGMKLTDIRAARANLAGAFKTDYPFATLDLAIRQHKIKCFYLCGASSLMFFKVKALAHNWEKISHKIKRERGPFIYRVSRHNRLSRVL